MARQKRGEEKYEKLLEGAKGIVLESGIDALTIARLAGRIQASVGGVYRHFASKEDIILALERWSIDAFASMLEAELGALDGALASAPERAPKHDALVRVLVAVTAYLRHAARDPERHQLIAAFLGPRQMLDDERAKSLEVEAVARVIGKLASLFDAAAEVGALAPGQGVARTYVAWALVLGFDSLRKRDRILPEALRVGALLPAALEALLSGWGASPSDLRAALERLRALEADGTLDRALAAPVVADPPAAP